MLFAALGTRASAYSPADCVGEPMPEAPQKVQQIAGRNSRHAGRPRHSRPHLGDASGVLRGTGPPPTRVVKWRIGPTFPWAMCGVKDPPELAMRCRFASSR